MLSKFEIFFTSHAMHDLLELVVAASRMHSCCSFQNVLDAAEAHALLGHPFLGAALAVVVVDGGGGGEAPQGHAGGRVVSLINGANVTGTGRGYQLVRKN